MSFTNRERVLGELANVVLWCLTIAALIYVVGM